jgi:hypothetical protein
MAVHCGFGLESGSRHPLELYRRDVIAAASLCSGFDLASVVAARVELVKDLARKPIAHGPRRGATAEIARLRN